MNNNMFCIYKSPKDQFYKCFSAKKNALKGVVLAFIYTVTFEFSLMFLKEISKNQPKKPHVILHDLVFGLTIWPMNRFSMYAV